MKQLSIAAVVVLLSATSMSAQTATTSAVTAANKYHGAPGPVLGAGLPGLAIGIGYGIYWLRKRRRKAG
jgi:hypothetical protein